MRVFFSALIVAAMALVTPAHAWFHGGGASAACPYGTGSGDNGCSGANQNGSFHNANLINTAQSSGGNSLLPLHSVVANGIVPYNIPAADYPIGPDKTLTPRDPRTYSGDAHCAYSAGSFSCFPLFNGEVVHVTVDNYDFSGSKIGQAPIGVYVGGCGNNCYPGAGSSVTFTNDYFAITSTVSPLGWGGGTHGNWNIIYKFNQCDGAAVTSATAGGYCLNDDIDAVGDSVDIEYSAFTNQNVPRISNGETNATFTLKYSYMEINNLNSSIHGEIMLRNCSGAQRQNCHSSDNYTGNFIVWQSPFTSGLNNGTFFPSDGANDGVVIDPFIADHNVIVTNRNGSITAINQAILATHLSTFGAVQITSNWVDAYGADDCSISGSKSGGNSVTASQTGTVVNVTAMSPSFNNGVEVGNQFSRPSGYSTSTILSYGTAGGGLGTYNVSGSTQNVSSDSLWTLVPGYTSLQFTPENYNLSDPSHTGVAAAIGLNGPQMVATTCLH